MSGYITPHIVTDGLVLYLDAANPISFTLDYAAKSIAWNNISQGDTEKGFLSNGAIFDSGNQGSVLFDGVNDSIIGTGSADLDVGLSGSATIDIFVNHNHPLAASAGTIFQFGAFGGASTSYGIMIYQNYTAVVSEQTIVPISTISVLPNTWYNIIVTFNPSGGGSYYLNGNFISNHAFSTSTSSINRWTMGDWNKKPFVGKVASVKIYNRELSASEVSQNYKAIKYRFGL